MGGCTASKLDNEDTVRRCKERKRLIKDAVNARHHLSAAHSDYLRALRLTGSALLDFASGEPLSVSNQTPTVFLHTKPQKDPSFINNNPNLTRTHSSISYQNSDFVTQTPKLTKTHSTPLKGYSYFEENDEVSSSPTITRSKVPHILSESSPNFTPNLMKKKPIQKKSQFGGESNYSETQSQASSVWNWENFYPPSPPGSDFFRKNSHIEEDTQSKMSGSVYSKQQHQQKHHLKEEEMEEEEEEREEVQCSEWDDHYSTSSSDTKSDDDEDEEDLESRSEMGSRSNFGSSVHNGVGNKSMGHGQFDQKSDFDAGSSVSWNMGNNNKSVHNHGGGGCGGIGVGGGGEISDMKLVVRHKDLAEIAASIKEYFEKARNCSFDRSFRQLKSS